MTGIEAVIAVIVMNTPIYFFLFNIQKRITKIESTINGKKKK